MHRKGQQERRCGVTAGSRRRARREKLAEAHKANNVHRPRIVNAANDLAVVGAEEGAGTGGGHADANTSSSAGAGAGVGSGTGSASDSRFECSGESVASATVVGVDVAGSDEPISLVTWRLCTGKNTVENTVVADGTERSRGEGCTGDAHGERSAVASSSSNRSNNNRSNNNSSSSSGSGSGSGSESAILPDQPASDFRESAKRQRLDGQTDSGGGGMGGDMGVGMGMGMGGGPPQPYAHSSGTGAGLSAEAIGAFPYHHPYHHQLPQPHSYPPADGYQYHQHYHQQHAPPLPPPGGWFDEQGQEQHTLLHGPT